MWHPDARRKAGCTKPATGGISGNRNYCRSECAGHGLRNRSKTPVNVNQFGVDHYWPLRMAVHVERF